MTESINVMDIMGFKTELNGKHIHAYPRDLVEKWLADCLNQKGAAMKRYGTTMAPCSDGPWVRYRDFQKLQDELESYKLLAKRLAEGVPYLSTIGADKFIDDMLSSRQCCVCGQAFHGVSRCPRFTSGNTQTQAENPPTT